MTAAAGAAAAATAAAAEAVMAAQPINEKSIHNINRAGGLRLLLTGVLRLTQ